MANNIKGIRMKISDKYAFCHIDTFSTELENIIRDQLTSICHGPSKASLNRKAYNYVSTLNEFLKRYEPKPSATKIGMVGEMLTHILLINYFPKFNTISPYFNLEERSIKKGFDVVLFSKEKNEIWISEVKSGEIHKGKNSNETNRVLLATAKNDLKKRLNEEETSTLWENAINGAYIALDNNKDTKDAVLDILMDIEDQVIEKKSKSQTKNVILVSSLFSCLSDEIIEKVVEEYSDELERENLFKKTIVFSIQKNTYDKVVDFLRKEVMQ